MGHSSSDVLEVAFRVREPGAIIKASAGSRASHAGSLTKESLNDGPASGGPGASEGGVRASIPKTSIVRQSCRRAVPSTDEVEGGLKRHPGGLQLGAPESPPPTRWGAG